MEVSKHAVIDELTNVILSGVDVLEIFLKGPRQFRGRFFHGRVSVERWRQMIGDPRKKRAIKKLRQDKRLKDRQKGNKVIVAITRDLVAGRIKEMIREQTNMLPDKQICLISFDFPVGANQARTFWRRFLASVGCRREHLSLWSTNKDIIRHIVALTHIMNTGSWVKVYTSKKMN